MFRLFRKETPMVNLGDEVRDTVTGFRGVVIGKTLFLHGCTRVGVQPPVGTDGTLKEAAWFDEPQMEVLTPGKVRPALAASAERERGGPMISVPTRNTPR